MKILVPTNNRFLVTSILCVFFFLITPVLKAVTNSSIDDPSNSYSYKILKSKRDIYIPKNLKRRVKFWEKIFSKYHTTTTVIHDKSKPWVIVDVIDHRILAMKKSQSIVPNIDERKMINKRYLDRYVLALKRFKKLGKKATKYGAIEKRIYSVYKKHRLGLINLYNGNHKLRTQTGLADEFIQAMIRSKNIMPAIERIFADEGIPIGISRLPFVESMFNLHAKSKVGAAGMWQFMRKTAKQFISVNYLIDERYMPLKATKAAAQLLARNYKSLKSWPLAITAYNHGRAGVARATRKVGTTDLGKIIDRYKKRSFGFATKNFFSEFLAASNVYEKNYKKGLHLTRLEKGVELRHMTLNQKVSVNQLIKKTPITLQTLEKYNPALSSKALTKYRYNKLPKDFEINVPSDIYLEVREKLINISPKRVALSPSKRRKR